MITLDADFKSSGNEVLSISPEHSMHVNDDIHRIDKPNLPLINNTLVGELPFAEIFANEGTILPPMTTDEWKPSMENEFQVLAEKEAFDEISEQEVQRLETLSRIRSRLTSKMSAEEIFFLYNLQKKQEKLLSDLNSYVSFINSSHL